VPNLSTRPHLGVAVFLVSLALSSAAAPGLARAASTRGSPAEESRVSAYISGGGALFQVVTRSSRKAAGGTTPVYRPAGARDRDALAILRRLEEGFAPDAFAICRLARNFLANEAGDGRATTPRLLEPIRVIHGAGVPAGRAGFWLESPEGRGLEDHTSEPFILAEAGGRLDLDLSIAYQVGRLIVSELCGTAPRPPSTTVPDIDTATDWWTAFAEGWAAHLQAVAVDHCASAAQAEEYVRRGSAAMEYWLRRMSEDEYRGGRGFRDAVAAALGRRPGAATLSFPVWRALYGPAYAVSGIRSAAFRWSRGRGVSDAGAGGHRSLRNPSEMLATPGVVASVVYALVTDPRIQSLYRPPEFYAPFLHPSVSRTGGSPQPVPIFTPLQNAYAKVMYVMATAVRPNLSPTARPPVVRLIEEYAAVFPDEAEAAYQAFLWATGGATLDPVEAEKYAADSLGRSPRSLERYAGFLGGLLDALLRGEKRLDRAVGPQIWLLDRDNPVGPTACDRFAVVPIPRSFDLNAAGLDDLLSVRGMTAETAANILEERRVLGYFTTIQELAQVRGMRPELLNRLQAMKAETERFLAGPGAPGVGDAGEAYADQLPVAMSYVRMVAVRVLAGFCACLIPFAVCSKIQASLERGFLGEWGTPVPRRTSGFGAVLQAVLGVAGAWVALGALLFLLPPVATVLRLAMGAAAALGVWAFGVLPQIRGICAFAGFSVRYSRFRALWSLLTLAAVLCTAFVVM
jgi:hypothetical protein